MNESENINPIIPPIKTDPSLEAYYCPHCGEFLFKGKVKKLNMVCHHCQILISAPEKDLIKHEVSTD